MSRQDARQRTFNLRGCEPGFVASTKKALTLRQGHLVQERSVDRTIRSRWRAGYLLHQALLFHAAMSVSAASTSDTAQESAAAAPVLYRVLEHLPAF